MWRNSEVLFVMKPCLSAPSLSGAFQDHNAGHFQRAAQLLAASNGVHGAHVPHPSGQFVFRIYREDEGGAIFFNTLELEWASCFPLRHYVPFRRAKVLLRRRLMCLIRSVLCVCPPQCVAAFAVSAVASQWERTGKPFNPLLGETYELVRWVEQQESVQILKGFSKTFLFPCSKS